MHKGRIEAQYGVILYNFIKKNKIKSIIETGMAHGLSSYFFLSAIGKQGLLVSIEPNLVETIEHYSHPNWMIVINTSQNILSYLIRMIKPDLFFHDSQHTYENMRWEYETVLSHCKYIASHDIKRNTAWEEFTKKNNAEIIYQKGKLGICKI